MTKKENFFIFKHKENIFLKKSKVMLTKMNDIEFQTIITQEIDGLNYIQD